MKQTVFSTTSLVLQVCCNKLIALKLSVFAYLFKVYCVACQISVGNTHVARQEAEYRPSNQKTCMLILQMLCIDIAIALYIITALKLLSPLV